MLLASGKLSDAIVHLELTEEEFDFPPCGVDGADVMRFESLGIDVGDVEMVASLIVVPCTDDAKAAVVVRVAAGDLDSVVHDDFEVGRAAPQLRDHVLPHLALEAAMTCLIARDDARIGVLA